MLPIMLRITLGVGLVLYFTVILLFLKYKAIELKYTLIAFLLIISMSLTSIVSRQSNRIRILVQEIAILKKRIQDLEDKEY